MYRLKTTFFSHTNKTYRHPLLFISKNILFFYIAVGFLLRIVLMFISPSDAGFNVGNVIGGLLTGFISDIGMGLLLLAPLLVFYTGWNEWKYRKGVGACIEIVLLSAMVYALSPHSVFHEYGGGAPRIARLLIGWKLLSFSLRFFLPGVRKAWRSTTLYLTWGVYLFLILVATVGEVLFWQEFGVRYNFIAVDYLVYTHEVIGNIMASYAIGPILMLLIAVTLAIIVVQSRKSRFVLENLMVPKTTALHFAGALCLFATGWMLTSLTYNLRRTNQYVTQIGQNGAYDFARAFIGNTLAYDRFYPMLPEPLCRTFYHRLAGLNPQGYKNLANNGRPQRRNIVLVTVESLSADFLTRYGNPDRLTPHLDKLMEQSLVMDSLYANGNRTVRGLEALSLCIPPTAGESIIKQKNNRMGNLSVGALLREQGYRVQFLYGGNSYFDNMKDFFSHNGYEVIDRKDIASDKVTFANIWGVCDEDIFTKSLEVFDADAATGRPFFAHIMTTSNHRPYTYPEGRIRTDGEPHTRAAAVRYTDYAIGKFMAEAAHKPWYANTVFIIVADHCASSAGKTSLPLEKYHIPCIIYGPGIRPQHIGTVCSQIDVMPTVISLLHLPVQARFAGGNVLSPDFKGRAFVATYQDLGYYENHELTVLSPVRKVQQFKVMPQPDHTFNEIAEPYHRTPALTKAMSYYQYINLYLERKHTAS